MLDFAELQAVRTRFGVSEAQVRRDHLISHLLAAIAFAATESVIFFGGTALARTVLPEGRLSEDVDLIAVGSRRRVAGMLEREIPLRLRREYPDLRWETSLTDCRGSEPALLREPDGLTVRIQLLDALGYPNWPTMRVDLEQRYSDAPPATMVVLTPAALVAAKLVAWRERRAARDLWDLWALAKGGYLTREAGELYARLGPTNTIPSPDEFEGPPTEERWQRDLAGQVRLTITASEAMSVIRAALPVVG